MQYINLIGFLGGDPQERVTANNHKVINFSVAVSLYSQKETKTQWYKINVWEGPLRKFCSNLKKGSLVYIGGELDFPKVYQGKDGKQKVDLSVKAAYIKFMPTAKKDKEEYNIQKAKEDAIKEAEKRYPTEIESVFPF